MNEMISILNGLVQNICLFLALSYLFGAGVAFFKHVSSKFEGVANGIAFAIVAGIGMMMNIEVVSGIVVDGRMIIVCAAGAFGGRVAGGTATLLAMLFRLFMGGTYIAIECLGILGAGLIGIFFHIKQRPDDLSVSPKMLLSLGLILAVQNHLWALIFLPSALAWHILKCLSIPTLLLYPLGLLLLGSLLNRTLRDVHFTAILKKSEEKYRTLFENMAQGAFYRRADGTLLECNSAVLKMFGLTRDQFMLRSAKDPSWRVVLEDGSELPDERRPSMVALKTGQSVRDTIVGVFNPRRQEFVWMNINAIPLFEPKNKNPYQVFVTLHDITERKKAEAALVEKNKLVKDLIASVREGIIIYDCDLKYQIWNPFMEQFSGRKASEVLGRHPLEVFPFLEDLGVVTRLESVLKGNSPGVYEYSFVAPDTGRIVWISDECSPLRNAQGEISGAIVTIRDITERKRSELSLKNERDLLERVMETSPAGISRVDANGLVVYANSRAEDIHGIQLSDMPDRTYNDSEWKITDLDGGPFPNEKLPFFMVKQSLKPVFDVRHAIQWPDGRRVLLSINAAPLINDAGEFDGMVATMEDISEKYQAEQKYQMLFREMIDGFALHEIICDDNQRPADYRFLAINPAFERLTGLKAADLIGRTVLEVLPHTEAYWIETYGRVALTGEPAFFENYSQELSRYYQVRAFRPALNQFACIVVDVTRQKEWEQALWESTERFQKVFESQLDAIFVLNAESPARIMECNKAAANVFGYEVVDLIGGTIDKLHVDESHRKKFQEILDAAIAREGSLRNTEFYMKRKGGTVFPSEHTVMELKNDADQRTGWVFVTRDLTERKEMEVHLQQAQKMEAIGTLAGGIAHDFNNILFPIVGMAELLLEDLPPGSSEHECAAEIFNSGQRGSDLVKQILAFGRQSEHQIMPVRLQQVMYEILKLIRSTIPADIEIISEIDPECGMVRADPIQMHQVVMNLITNAYHAVEANRGSISVNLKEIELSDNENIGVKLKPGHYAMLTIKDNGLGIDPSILSKIFNPYFTTKPQGKGTGLGLAIVYGIIKNHKGDITVESEVGKGTGFKIFLPLMEKLETAPVKESDEKIQGGSERILLVDDEEAIVRLESKMLERLGYRVTMRTSSVEALEAFKSNPNAFDLVITDMTMPNITGERLALELLALRPELPVIICTGFSERITPQKAEEIGIGGFLMKPIVKSELAQVVRNVLNKLH